MSDDTRDRETPEDAAPDTGGSTSAKKPSAGVDRRNLFKGLATLPVLGALGATAWGKRQADEARRQAIVDELGVSGDAPAIIDRLTSRGTDE